MIEQIHKQMIEQIQPDDWTDTQADECKCTQNMFYL